MSLDKLEHLTEQHIDVLGEIGNIGSGNSATALASLLNTAVDIEIPTITLMDFEQAAKYVGEKNEQVLGISLDLSGDIEGMILHIVHHTFAAKLVNTFYEKEITGLDDISEMDLSVISEMGNITSAAYVNAISTLTSMFINISTPNVFKDTAENILEIPTMTFQELGRKVLFIDEKLNIGGTKVKSSLILILELESLKRLFDRLHIIY